MSEKDRDAEFEDIVQAHKQRYIPSFKTNVLRTVGMVVVGMLMGYVWTTFTETPQNLNAEDIQNWHLIDGISKGFYVSIAFFALYAVGLIWGALKYKSEATAELFEKAMKRAKGDE